MKNQKGLFAIVVALLSTALLTGCGATSRGDYATALKANFGLEAGFFAFAYSPDESELLRPMVTKKLTELESRREAAKAKMESATPETSQSLIADYQQARDRFESARTAAILYGLIPDPNQKK